MSHVPPRLDRRAFLGCAVDALGCVVAARTYGSIAPQTLTHERSRISPSLRVGLVVIGANETFATSALGVELGIDEATRAAALLGGSIEVVSPAKTIGNAIALVTRDRLTAMLCATKADDIAELAHAVDNRGTLLFNLSASDDSLRNERCSRSAFHVCASDAMRRSALDDMERSPGRTDATIREWSDRLERFGAAQLNDRFRSRFHRPMDSLAWAGWFAVKVAWEASLRAHSADGSAMTAYLERETAQFDGQKGLPLSFRAWDHQLRQPLYAVSASRPSEPVAIPASPGNSRAALDVLGTNDEASSCHWR